VLDQRGYRRARRRQPPGAASVEQVMAAAEALVARPTTPPARSPGPAWHGITPRRATPAPTTASAKRSSWPSWPSASAQPRLRRRVHRDLPGDRPADRVRRQHHADAPRRLRPCRSCGDECEHHADKLEHRRVCAEVCRRCEQACRDLLAAISW